MVSFHYHRPELSLRGVKAGRVVGAVVAGGFRAVDVKSADTRRSQVGDSWKKARWSGTDLADGHSPGRRAGAAPLFDLDLLGLLGQAG